MSLVITVHEIWPGDSRMGSCDLGYSVLSFGYGTSYNLVCYLCVFKFLSKEKNNYVRLLIFNRYLNKFD